VPIVPPPPTPSETATDAATLTLALSETPTETGTPTLTLEGTASETATASITPTGTEASTVTPTASETPTETPTATQSPLTGLSQLSLATFDQGLPLEWLYDYSWQAIPSAAGNVLEIVDQTQPAIFAGSQLDDVALETRFYYDGASLLRLSVRYNGSAENYTVTVFPDGRMTLARNFAVVVASLPGIALNNWHTLQVSAVGATIRLLVNGVEVITYSDPQPLPAGMIALSAESFQNAVLLDDLAVWSSEASAFIPRSFARQPAGAAVAFLQGGSGFANRVAYVERQRINSNNIYTFRFLEPDNRLRTLANQYYWPAFSPDGAFAAAVRNADYTGTLRLMRVYTPQEDNLFGGELELAYSANRFIQCPVWSPDGQFVAYLEAFTGQKTRLYVASAAGPNTAWGAPRLLDERSYLHCPEWSPLAGQHVLAYSASVDMLVNGLLYLNRDIFTVNVDTNARTQITNSLDDEWDIDWSPDGTKIAFHTFIDSDTELFYVSPIAAGGTVVRLTDNDQTDWGPVWGNDSQTLAFFRSGAVGGPDNESGIFRMNIAAPGSAYRISGTDEADRNPRWSLDGSWIAVESRRDPNGLDTEVFAFPSAGGAVFRLTDNAVNEQDVTWGAVPVAQLITETPTLPPTATPIPYTCQGSATATVNLRYGPNTNFAVIREIEYQESIQVIGKTATSLWLLVLTDHDQMGWATHDFISLVNCVEANLRIYPDDVAAFPTPTPTPTVTPSTTPTITPIVTPSVTPTLMPGFCNVASVNARDGLFFRSQFTGESYPTRVYLVWNASDKTDTGLPSQPEYMHIAERYVNGQGTRDFYHVVSLEAVAFAGIANDQQWMEMRITVANASNQQSSATGYMALNFLSFVPGCDITRLPGYVPPPTPEPIVGPIRYISCLANYGLGPGEDRGDTPLYYAVDIPGDSVTYIPAYISVNATVRVLGRETDQSVRSLINTFVQGGRVTSPPPTFPTNDPGIIAAGWTLVQWDDQNSSTVDNIWWIVTTVLAINPDCGLGTVIPTPTIPAPTPTPGSVFERVFLEQVPFFPTNPPVGLGLPSQNPPSVMGNAGLHGIRRTIDLVTLSAEWCIDSPLTLCLNDDLYNPDTSEIPIFAPVAGCVFSEEFEAETPIGVIRPVPPTVLDLKVGCLDPSQDIPALFITFTHIRPVRDAQGRLPDVRNVNRGDLIGYLCPQNNLSACYTQDTGVSPLQITHLALSMRYEFGPNARISATDTELLRLLPNLHDCIASASNPLPLGAISNSLCAPFRAVATQVVNR
jgi:Tol biopolymer transport system component